MFRGVFLPCLFLTILVLCGAAAGRERVASAESRALAADGADNGWVLLEGDGTFTPAILKAIGADLAAGLGSRAKEVRLTANSSEKPAARIFLRRNTDGTITLEVHDFLTNKRLARDANLRDLPGDGHALALAVAVDELLRASWAELDQAKPRQGPPDTQVQARAPARGFAEAPADSDQRDRASQLRASFRPAFEWWEVGQVLLGADVGVALLRGRWAMEMRGGVRRGLDASASNGSIQAEAALAGAFLSFDLLEDARLQLAPQVGLQGGIVSFQGVAEGGATAKRVAGAVCSARAGLVAGLLFSDWSVSADGGVGAPIATVQAQVDGKVATGAAGLEVWAGMSGGYVF